MMTHRQPKADGHTVISRAGPLESRPDAGRRRRRRRAPCAVLACLPAMRRGAESSRVRWWRCHPFGQWKHPEVETGALKLAVGCSCLCARSGCVLLTRPSNQSTDPRPHHHIDRQVGDAAARPPVVDRGGGQREVRFFFSFSNLYQQTGLDHPQVNKCYARVARPYQSISIESTDSPTDQLRYQHHHTAGAAHGGGCCGCGRRSRPCPTAGLR